MILKNARIVVEGNETKIVDIKISGHRITRIADFIEADDEECFDLHKKLVMPGGIDVHVHLREPGHEEKETIATGTAAAAHGGFTTIMAMPNVIPSPDSIEAMGKYLKLIKKEAKVNVYPYATITKEEGGKDIVDMKAIKKLGIRWYSDDGVGIQSHDVMVKAMRIASENDVMLACHTEDMHYRKPGACVHEGKANHLSKLLGIPSACEYEQIERDLKLAKHFFTKYHICHMSAKESVELLRKYKNLGVDASGEVTTHHLLLNEFSVSGPNYKMNPPLRSEEDRQALIKGLLDGTIDMIASDHAPHTKEDKDQPMETAAFGIVSLETSIPLIYTTFVDTGVFTLQQMQNFMMKNPAKRFGFEKKGEIREGYDADLIALTDKPRVIDSNKFMSKGKNTPFDGREVKGNVVLTIVGGKIAYSELKGVKA